MARANSLLAEGCEGSERAMPTKITAITNQKGGVGKTTVCAALLSCLHHIFEHILIHSGLEEAFENVRQ